MNDSQMETPLMTITAMNESDDNYFLTEEHNVNLHHIPHIGFYEKHIKQHITLDNALKVLGAIDLFALLYPIYPFIQQSCTPNMLPEWTAGDNIALEIFISLSFCILAISILRQKKVQDNLKKIKNWLKAHQVPLLIFIAIGVAMGESAPVYYFITSLQNNPKFSSFLIKNHLLNELTVFAIAATFSAFILSFALFYKSMEDTVNAASGIVDLIKKGQTKEADGTIVTLCLFGRFLLFISILFCLFSAAVCGALAANSIIGSFGSTNIVYAAAVAVFFFEIIATTCVNYVFFGQTLLDAFNNPWKRFIKYNKKLMGIKDEDNCAMIAAKSIWSILFWALFLTLSAFTGYICSELFYYQLKNFSLCKISLQWALTITIGAMIVNCIFRFKSIFDLLDYIFNFKEKQNGPSAMRRSQAGKNASTSKKLAFLMLDLLFLGVLGIMSPLLNGSGQGFGAFSIGKADLPKSLGGFLSSNFCLWICFVGITLASSGANAIAYLKMLNKTNSINKLRGLDSIDFANKDLTLFSYKKDKSELSYDDDPHPIDYHYNGGKNNDAGSTEQPITFNSMQTTFA
jgi:hypothetical protein